MVRIVTDSTSYITKVLLEDHDIKIISLFVKRKD